MARTTLLTTLQQLAGRPLPRDRFLQLGAAAAATLATPAPKSVLPKRRERIAIVGAGIAGLTCAMTLHDAGIESTVIESSQRIGGRMHSEHGYWDDDEHTEWCGSLIDTGHRTMHKLAHRFN